MLLCAFVLPLVGCGKSSDDLTAEDLAFALDARWWHLEIPEDHDPDWILGMCFKGESGILGRITGTKGWEPGSHVKVILSDLDKEWVRYAVIGSGQKCGGSRVNMLFNLGDYVEISKITGSTVSLDKILLARSESDYVGLPGLRKGDIGIAISSAPQD
jgi:hypothetical protein